MQTDTLVVWEGGWGISNFQHGLFIFMVLKQNEPIPLPKYMFLTFYQQMYTPVWNRGIHFFHICTFVPLLPFDPKTFLQIFLAKPYKNMYNDLNQIFEM